MSESTLQLADAVFYADAVRTVEYVGDPTAGGAHAEFHVTEYNGGRGLAEIKFQPAPIPEVGVIGVTNEVLLAIVAKRLHEFQAGPYACRENAIALTHTIAALEALEARTRAREKRGVEGTVQP